jgi:hypothetical protein
MRRIAPNRESADPNISQAIFMLLEIPRHDTLDHS